MAGTIEIIERYGWYFIDRKFKNIFLGEFLISVPSVSKQKHPKIGAKLDRGFS